MYFAAKDINEENLKVLAGHPLPERFQSFAAAQSLRKAFGKEAVIGLDSMSEDFILIPTKRLAALQAENASLKEQLKKQK